MTSPSEDDMPARSIDAGSSWYGNSSASLSDAVGAAEIVRRIYRGGPWTSVASTSSWTK